MADAEGFIRIHGLGREFDYEDIPDGEKVFSRDGRRAAAWYISRHREDRYDDDTDYAIVVWDTATHAPIARFSRMYYVSEYTGTTRGKPLAELLFPRLLQSA